MGLESKTVSKEGSNIITFNLINKEQKEPFVGFVLRKKNIDTMAAVNFLARMTHNAIGNFTFCGTKDKRGETVQKIIVKNAVLKSLKGLEGKRMSQNGFEIQISNVQREKEALKLGDHFGNKFEIILRFLQPNPIDEL